MGAFLDYVKTSKYRIVRTWKIVSKLDHNFFVTLCFKLRRFACLLRVYLYCFDGKTSAITTSVLIEERDIHGVTARWQMLTEFAHGHTFSPGNKNWCVI
jgi:hypothetical protein